MKKWAAPLVALFAFLLGIAAGYAIWHQDMGIIEDPLVNRLKAEVDSLRKHDRELEVLAQQQLDTVRVRDARIQQLATANQSLRQNIDTYRAALGSHYQGGADDLHRVLNDLLRTERTRGSSPGSNPGATAAARIPR